MTPVLMAVSLLAGFGAGWLTKRHRLGLLAENNHWVGEEIQALKGADLDADVAAHRRERLSGELPAVRLKNDEPIEVEPFMADSGYRSPFDEPELIGPDQLAELREHAGRVCHNGNCGHPAVFAWEQDGFPFAACALCVELWWPDGPPAHVARLDPCPGCDGPLATLDDGSRWCPQCTSFWDPPDSDDPDRWVHTPCGTPISRDDDGTEWCPTCNTVITALPEVDDTSDVRALPSGERID